MGITAAITVGVAAVASTAYTIKKSNDAANSAQDAANAQINASNQQAQELQTQQATAQKQQADATAAQQRQAAADATRPSTGVGSGRSSTILTSPLGVTGTQTNNAGKTLLGT